MTAGEGAPPEPGGRRPRLVVRTRTAGGAAGCAPAGIVLVLHGGRADSTDPVRPWNLALARMRQFVRPTLDRGAPAGIAVAMLRYRNRGWNGPAADGHADAEWALADLARRYGPVPVALIGHSMGGRAALRAGGHASVVGVAALAPWVPRDEPVAHLAGRTVLIAHGSQDRVISPALSEDFARRAADAGARVCRLRVDGSGHAMLGRAKDWNELAAQFAVACVTGGPLPPPVARALAGESAAGPGSARVNGSARFADFDRPLETRWWRSV